MAKTTKKVGRTKEAGKKTRRVVAKIEKKTVMSKDQLSGLTAKMNGLENAQLRSSVEEQALRNTVLVLENTKLKINELERKVADQKAACQLLSDRYVKRNKEYTEYKAQLWKDLGYKENAGLKIDFETGEIEEE